MCSSCFEQIKTIAWTGIWGSKICTAQIFLPVIHTTYFAFETFDFKTISFNR